MNKVLSDNELFELFQQGTAPEREEPFVLRVRDELRNIRLLSRLSQVMMFGILTVFVTWFFMMAEFYGPMLNPLFELARRLLDDTIIQVGIGIICVLIMRRIQPLR